MGLYRCTVANDAPAVVGKIETENRVTLSKNAENVNRRVQALPENKIVHRWDLLNANGDQTTNVKLNSDPSPYYCLDEDWTINSEYYTALATNIKTHDVVSLGRDQTQCGLQGAQAHAAVHMGHRLQHSRGAGYKGARGTGCRGAGRRLQRGTGRGLQGRRARATGARGHTGYMAHGHKCWGQNVACARWAPR